MHYVLCKISELGSVTSWSCRFVVLLTYSNLFFPILVAVVVVVVASLLSILVSGN